MIPLFDWLAQRPKCFKIYVTENSELFQDTPNLAEDFDSPICLICTMAKIFNDYYDYKIVSHQFNVSEDSYLFLSLGIRWQDFFFAILWLVLLAPMIWPKGWSRLYRHPLFWPKFLHFQKFHLYNWFTTFWRQKEEIYYSVTIHLSLFIYHYSSVIIHDTVHSEFCLFKGGCPLC